MPAEDATLARLLLRKAERQPDAIALLAGQRPGLSYAALYRQARYVEGVLRGCGVQPRSRVAVVLPNGPEMASAFLGVAACAACAPLNPGYRADEFAFYLDDLGAQAVLVRAGEPGPIREVAARKGLRLLEIDTDAGMPAGQFRIAGHTPANASGAIASSPDDVALVLHTSGTTARPKIVPLTQANLCASAANIAAHLALGTDDRCLNVMPLFHIHGLVGALLATLAGGGSMDCSPGFDEERFFDWVAGSAPTWYTAVPTMHQAVLARGALYRQRALGHRFRFIRSSSAALAPKTAEGLRALTGAPVIEAYGMTEAAHQMASNPLPPGLQVPGSVGRASGVEIALMDEHGRLLPESAGGATGEIVIRGASVTAGYENNPEANEQAFRDGWFRTGDQGRFDAERRLYVTGRLKEIVNRGGEKISPREVDEALLEHPDVAQAVAFAAPHPSLGEDLLAAVVLRAGADRATAEFGLRQFLFERLAAFKVPSAIVCVDALPRGSTGKLQRRGLHEQLAGLLKAPYLAPRSDLEASLAAIFREVLGGEVPGGEVPGVHDNFFHRGGDSLRGVQVIARVNALFDIALDATALFLHPSIAALAVHVDSARRLRDELLRAAAAEIELLSDDEVEALLAAEAGADVVEGR